jgi:hypothetical protein
MFYNKLNKMIREDNVPLITKLKEFRDWCIGFWDAFNR